MSADVPLSDAGAATAVLDLLLQQHPDDEPSRMLHAPAVKTAGKVYAFASAGDLIVKLPAARVAELVRDGAGRPCTPNPDRPMKEWVEIPAPDEATGLAYALEARAFVAGDQ